VVQLCNSLGIVMEYINAGLTSIIQPCDVYCNRQLKRLIWSSYYSFKNSLNLSTASKVPVARENLVKWVENAFENIVNEQKKS
jgi:hypothetical protein